MAQYLGIILISLMTVFSYAQEEEKKPQQQEFKVVTVKGFVFNYCVENDNLIAKVSYPTKGWVSIGFNPVKKMKGANIIIGCFTDGKEIVADHFGTNPVTHKADTLIGGKNSIIESSCVEADGVTTLAFTIPLDSGDEKDGVLTVGKETKVIFAAGKKDNLKKRHAVRTSKKITL